MEKTSEPCILIADDNRDYSVYLMRELGGNAISVNTLKEAVYNAYTYQPVVIFLDIQWVEEGIKAGLQYVERFKAVCPFAHIVLMSAAYNDEDESIARSKGVDAYVEKGDMRLMRRIARAGIKIRRWAS